MISVSDIKKWYRAISSINHIFNHISLVIVISLSHFTIVRALLSLVYMHVESYHREAVVMGDVKQIVGLLLLIRDVNL